MRRNKLALPMKSMKSKVGQVCFFLYLQYDQNEEDIGSILGRIKQVIFLSPRRRLFKQREYPDEQQLGNLNNKASFVFKFITSKINFHLRNQTKTLSVNRDSKPTDVAIAMDYLDSMYSRLVHLEH